MTGNDSRRHSIMQMHLHRYTYYHQLILLILAVGLLVALPTQAATLTAEQAYQKGKILHFQDRFEEAEPYLLQAGESGNASAYYLIGDGVDGGYINILAAMSTKEYTFMKLAAENGHLLAMLRLVYYKSRASQSEKERWRNKLRQVLKPHAQSGNPLALSFLSGVALSEEDDGENFEYAVKAAYAGHPRSQYYIASEYENGEGWFFLPGSREKEVAKLYEASARGGYHDAIWYVGVTKVKAGETEKGMQILNVLIDKGDASKISTLGLMLSDLPDFDEEWVYDDKILGSTYMRASAIAMSDSDDTFQFFNEEAISLLTAEENQQVDQLTEEYLRTHTVYRQDGLDEFEYTVDNLHTALERWGGNAIE
ncbi:hypothetical protein [Enterovibrio norvegicus]|uniref:hypothetical protein n=1 Tax=Enterovibrio norvegicus TaxID=188144 RepID=UPI0024B16D73|nr:hypothetical protein [Enterovibrio norvegicus]